MAQIPYAPLKGVFFIHLISIVWATQSGWLPNSYLWYNFLLLVIIIWTLHSKDSEEAPFMGISLNAVSVVLDIFTICLYWPVEFDGPLTRFSNFCTIINLIMRLVSSIVLYRIFKERTATYGNYSLPSGLDNILPSNLSNSRRPYEDLDQPSATQNLTSPDNLMGSPVHDSQ